MGFLTTILAPQGSVSESEIRGSSAWLDDTGGISASTSAGVRINENNVMTLSAVFASARAIAEDVACLPLKAYRRLDGGGKTSAANDLRRAAPDGRMVNLYSLVHEQPNAEMGSIKLRSLLLWWSQMYGNGYAEIVYNEGDPVDLLPVHPHRVTPKRDDGGRLYYRVTNKIGTPPTDIPARNMLHVCGISNDGVMGCIIAKVGKDSFGIYMAAERFAGSYFGNGASLRGVVSFDADFKVQEARNEYIAAFNANYNNNKWVLADNGAKIHEIGNDPEKSQLVETLKFRLEEAARWFRVPPVIIGHNTGVPFANIEPLGQLYYNFGMKPWALRIEEECNLKLTVGDGALFVEHVVDSLMWANAKTRSEVHNKGIQGGWLSPNEVRSIENRNPVPGGDLYRVQQNLAVIGPDGQPVAVNKAEPAKPNNEAAKAMAMPVFVDAAERMIDREHKVIASKKKVTDGWLDEFYSGHHSQVVAAFTPAIVSLGQFVGSQVEGVADRYADAHCGESRRRLDAGEDPSAWNIDRPAWIARYLTDEVCKEPKKDKDEGSTDE